MSLGNLLDCPMYRLEDRRTIAKRALAALLDDPDCRYKVAPTWQKLTPDQLGNWEAREHFVHVLRSLPAPALPKIEPAHEEPVDNPPTQ